MKGKNLFENYELTLECKFEKSAVQSKQFSYIKKKFVKLQTCLFSSYSEIGSIFQPKIVGHVD